MKSFTKKMTLTAMLAAAAFTAKADHLSENLMFSARMNGANEVPAVTSGGNGVATFVLNGTRDTMCVTVYMSGLTEPVNGIHIHSGSAGTNGSVLIDLTPDLSGFQLKTILTGSDLTPTVVKDFLDGNLYINAHTATNPNGEIRGQITLEKDYAFRAYLDGTQEVPMVSTSAMGVSAMNLSPDGKRLNVWATANGLSGSINAAHLHFGLPGTSGPAIVDLSPYITDHSIEGTVDVSGVTGLLDSLLAGHVYINMHTVANPNGEIRGNVFMDNALAFDAFLTTDQETQPPTVTTARGTGYFSLNNTFNQMNFDLVVDGLSGPITGAHLHTGAPGTAGGVTIDLSANVSGNYIGGNIGASELTPQVITDLLEGNIYINVHTSANPNGELRGQLYRTAREGYSVDMSGDQEVPAVSTSAFGGGMISMGREQTDLHVMLVVNGLAGAVTGARLHNAAVGTNGPVIFDMTSWFAATGIDDTAFGYWTVDDATPFTSAEALAIRNGEVYANVLNTGNSNGEIRGQVIRGSACATEVLGVNELAVSEASFAVYPNPFNDQLTLSVDAGGSHHLIVTDVYGKTVHVQDFNGTGTEVALSALPAGIYFIALDGSANVLKVVKR